MTLPLFDPPPLTDAKPPPTLRPYQQRGIVNLRAFILMGKRRILAVGPTSLGKMVMIAAITRMSTLPALFIAHRQELIDQCAKQLARFGLTNIGVIRGADHRYNPGASVQIASIATLARRDKPFLKPDWKPGDPPHLIIFIDEAHRAGSDSYIEHVFRQYPGAIIIGFTATPHRLDGRPLGGELFEELVMIATYEELFKRPDWLARPDVFGAPIKPDVSQVRMSGSNFDEEALAAVVHTNELEGQIVDQWLRLANRFPVFNEKGVRVPEKFTIGEYRPTIVYAVNIEHSKAIAQRFEAAGVLVAHLDGDTPDDVRKGIWEKLASGELRVVCNCNVAVEGVDLPEVKCVVHARPTHSIVMWRQSCGRPMRPYNGIIPLILDHAGNMDRIGCPFEDLRWSLKARPARVGNRLPMKLCRACFAYCAPQQVVCPFCGTEFPKAEDRPLPAETSAELLLRQTEPEVLKRSFFHRQVTMAKSRGFRPGYAAAMYKENYGEWPPREWSDRVKADFAQDGAWQMSLKRRLERKEAKEAREKIEDEQMQKKELSERENQMLIVYATHGKDERIEPDWWPMSKRILGDFVRRGWLSVCKRDGLSESEDTWEITEAGMKAYAEACAPKTEEERAIEQTTRAMAESDDESFAGWWEGQQ